MAPIIAPAIIRGRIITSDLVPHNTRDGTAAFHSPDPAKLVDLLPLTRPEQMRDLYALRLTDIVDYLAELGGRLTLEKNEFLQQALEQSCAMSDMTPSVLSASYREIPKRFDRASLLELAETSIGIAYLDGWVKKRMHDGVVASIRAFGARCVHIVAGNSPSVSAATVIRGAITRGDTIIKTPSNDPLTSLAIARTMVSMAPDHPITKHLTCAYWKGGSASFEERLYRPQNVEKIVAWGGMASLKHVTRYIQPGLELISLDPKRSGTIIGAEAFSSEETMLEAAGRAALDVGGLNQLGCVNARIIYVVSGTTTDGLRRASEFSKRLHERIQALPPEFSTPARRFDPELRADIDALRANPDFYTVNGGLRDEGAVILSHTSDPVEFHRSLAGRVANVIPIDTPDEALAGMSAWTQTIGIYPESLKAELRDLLPLYGAQRIVSLGYALGGASSAAQPQDAIEPVRRMVKWIVDECRPEPELNQ